MLIETILEGSKKKEDPYIVAFVKFYLSQNNYKANVIHIQTPDTDKSRTNPDYLLEEANIAIEVKEIYSPGKKYQDELWRSTCDRLRYKIVERMRTAGLSGLFEIPVSYFWGIKKADKKSEERFIKTTLENISNGKFKKTADGNAEIIFTNSGILTGYSTDANKDEFRIAVEKILPKANKQLGQCNSVSKSILLLINNIPIRLFKLIGFSLFREVIQQTSKDVKNNINEIWVHYGKDGEEKYRQLYP